jgi:hypothetical protein
MGTEGFFAGGKASEKLITHLHIVKTSRNVELSLHYPICLYGVVFI